MSDCLLCPMPMNYEMLTSSIKSVPLNLDDRGGKISFGISSGDDILRCWWPVELERTSFWSISVPMISFTLTAPASNPNYISANASIVVARNYESDPDVVEETTGIAVSVSSGMSQNYSRGPCTANGGYVNGESLAIGIQIKITMGYTQWCTLVMTMDSTTAVAKFYN